MTSWDFQRKLPRARVSGLAKVTLVCIAFALSSDFARLHDEFWCWVSYSIVILNQI